MKHVACLLLLSLPSTALAQQTWYVVPGDPGWGGNPGSGSLEDPYRGLQFAIDRPTTLSGDRLELAGGTYDGPILLGGKALEISGPFGGGAQVTGGATVLTVVGIETAGTLLRDIEFRGPGRCLLVEYTMVDLLRCRTFAGTGDGGGLTGLDAGVRMRNCLVDSCGPAYQGAGIRTVACDLTLQGCEFQGNGHLLGGGPFTGSYEAADLWCEGGVLRLSDCLFEHGSADHSGSIRIAAEQCRIEGSQFLSCGAQRYNAVGGISGDLVEFESNLVLECSSGDYGGGIGIGGGLVFVSGSAFVHNGDSIGNTGALGIGGSLAQVEDCLFESNFSVRGGAVGHGGSGHVRFEDCTFRGNVAMEPNYLIGGDGGAVYAYGSGTQEFQRCVFERNVAEGLWSFQQPGFGHPGVGGALLAPNATLHHCTFLANECQGPIGGETGPTIVAASLDHCIVREEAPHAFDPLAPPANVTYSLVQGGWPGVGNLDGDPLFWFPEDGDLHLRPGSPAIDAGDPLGELDPDGSVADLGAFPFDAAYTPAPATYCEAKLSAAGCLPQLGWEGVASLGDPAGVLVHAEQVEPGRWGLGLWSLAPDALPFAGGTLCVGAGWVRGPAHLSQNLGGGACGGRLELLLAGSELLALNVAAGDSTYVQFWYRDPASAEPVGLSAGLRVTWQP